MKCSQCEKEGKKSKVYPGASSRTLLYCAPFYDEEGNCHDHDLNTTTTKYSCSNGHEWTEKSKGSCSCGVYLGKRIGLKKKEQTNDNTSSH